METPCLISQFCFEYLKLFEIESLKTIKNWAKNLNRHFSTEEKSHTHTKMHKGRLSVITSY